MDLFVSLIKMLNHNTKFYFEAKTTKNLKVLKMQMKKNNAKHRHTKDMAH